MEHVKTASGLDYGLIGNIGSEEKKKLKVQDSSKVLSSTVAIITSGEVNRYLNKLRMQDRLLLPLLETLTIRTDVYSRSLLLFLNMLRIIYVSF